MVNIKTYIFHKTWCNFFPAGPTTLQQRSNASARDPDSADIVSRDFALIRWRTETGIRIVQRNNVAMLA